MVKEKKSVQIAQSKKTQQKCNKKPTKHNNCFYLKGQTDNNLSLSNFGLDQFCNTISQRYLYL